MAKLILILAFVLHWLLVYGAYTTPLSSASLNCDGNETTLPCDEYDALTRVLDSLNYPSFHEISISYCGNSSSVELNINDRIGCNCSFKDNHGKNICHITEIVLERGSLDGSIDDAISGLQHLQNLSLSKNKLTGNLPRSLGDLTSLQYLTLSNNGLAGSLPENFGNLTSLQYLDLSSNYLEGPITIMSSLKNLMYIDLSSNFFNQDIPPSFGSFPLRYLNLRKNMFSGSIPNELGNLTHLEKLHLNDNELTGPLPCALGNLKILRQMELGSNYFTGSIPSTYSQFTQLEFFDISGNNLSGPIPQYIGKWNLLEDLWLVGNNFKGQLPEEIFSFPKLVTLLVSGLRNPGVKFPKQAKSEKLSSLVLRSCSINGTIPSYIANWTLLKKLDLSFNNLIGAIPKLNSYNVFLTRNRFNETFPSWITEEYEYVPIYMDLSFNNFRNVPHVDPINGTLLRVPETIIVEPTSDRYKGKKCPNKYNSLSINCGGEEVKFEKENYEEDNATSNFYQSPKGNWAYSFSGDYASNTASFAKLINQSDYIKNLTTVSFPEAQLYATVRVAPISLTYYAFCLHKAKYNIKLYFAEILFSTTGKRIFDIYVQGKLVLADFNIKKEAGGPNKSIVKSFTTTITENEPLQIDFFYTGKGSSEYTLGNGPLISAISITRVPRKLSAWEITAIVVGSILALIIFFAFLWRMGWIGDRELHTTNIELGAQSYSVREIINATQNFSIKTKIGKNGRFGIVYRAQLRNITAAVKKLFPEAKAAKEVIAEVSALSKLENQNLVKLMGSYSKKKLHLLIYEYMDNGSLEQVLFGSNRQLQLSWETRYKICQQIAQGLDFLHKKDPPIIHRNIKASNVLLDANFDAKISDFALAKLYEEEDPFMFTKAGSTLMYMAPEYASHRNISVRVDVYSFGILLLEIVSGIKIDRNLGDHNFTLYLLEKADRCHRQKKYKQLVDETLELSATTLKQANTIINLAMLCTEQLPSNRPSMSDVVNVLRGDLTVKDIVEKIQSSSHVPAANESSSQVLAANESVADILLRQAIATHLSISYPDKDISFIEGFSPEDIQECLDVVTRILEKRQQKAVLAANESVADMVMLDRQAIATHLSFIEGFSLEELQECLDVVTRILEERQQKAELAKNLSAEIS